MKISVIIPCFNCEKTLEFCLDSVFSQTSRVFEIICIDDGSVDSTLDLLYSLKSKCPAGIDYKIIAQENLGPSTARNRGIGVAKGDWIAFLDSDDYWSSTKIQTDIEFLFNNPTTKLISSCDLVVESKKIEFKDLLYRNYFITSSVMVATECIRIVKFDENQKYSEDYKTWLQIVLENDSYIISPQSSFPIDNNKAQIGFYAGNGLSSKLWKMEKGELSNFLFLYKNHNISLSKLLIVASFSFLKFIRRVYKVKRSVV